MTSQAGAREAAIVRGRHHLCPPTTAPKRRHVGRALLEARCRLGRHLMGSESSVGSDGGSHSGTPSVKFPQLRWHADARCDSSHLRQRIPGPTPQLSPRLVQLTSEPANTSSRRRGTSVQAPGTPNRTRGHEPGQRHCLHAGLRAARRRTYAGGATGRWRAVIPRRFLPPPRHRSRSRQGN